LRKIRKKYRNKKKGRKQKKIQKEKDFFKIFRRKFRRKYYIFKVSGLLQFQATTDTESVIASIAKGGNIDAFSNGPESNGVFGNKDWSYRA